MESRYSTREAADKMGIAHITLKKHVKKETFPIPPIVKVGGVSVRLWAPSDIKIAKKALSKLKPGRKKRD